jgi:ABC-type bacteriocin/lantibiotic exporter with double-glycine peptidase domain
MNLPSQVASCFKILGPVDRLKLFLVFLFNTSLAFLDLAAIAIVGLLGSLTVYGIQSATPSPLVQSILKALRIENLAFQQQVAIVGTIAATLLISKTILSAYSSLRISRFLTFQSAKISAKLIENWLASGLKSVRKLTSQETIFALTTGVNYILSGVIGAVISLTSEMFLLVVLSVGLFVVNPLLATLTVAYFSFLALILFLILHRRIGNLARSEADQSIRGNELIVEAISFYKEMTVKGRQQYYAQTLAESRYGLARVQALLSFLPNVSKYVLETGLVLGGIFLSSIAFFLYDASRAISLLSVFLVSSLRIAPSVLRMQTGLTSIRQNLASSTLTLNTVSRLEIKSSETFYSRPYEINHLGFFSEVMIERLFFKYEENSPFKFKAQKVVIEPGDRVQILGKSGEGKSTFLDLILGVLDPVEGKVLISGRTPKEAVNRWPGAISYVPQEAFISRGTILDNLTLGYKRDEIPLDEIWRALEIAQLSEYVSKQPKGLETYLGERGNVLSGGQRQRLGIARSLITHPKLIILDESTNALDQETEYNFWNSLNYHCPTSTILSVSHRSQNKLFKKSIQVSKGKVTFVT